MPAIAERYIFKILNKRYLTLLQQQIIYQPDIADLSSDKGHHRYRTVIFIEERKIIGICQRDVVWLKAFFNKQIIAFLLHYGKRVSSLLRLYRYQALVQQG